jgi:arylsulfatase A-like enzyme
VVKTPYLDQLFLSGCQFSQAYSACPSCIAARAAMFTGQSQETNGRVGYQDGVPWNYETTLAGEFTRHGYQTQAVGKMHVYPERSQLGFQNVILHDGHLHFARKQFHGSLDMVDDYLPWLRQQLGRDADYFDHGLNCNSFPVRPWDKPEYTHPTNYVTSQSIDFLRRRDPRKPFFLFMSYHRPHPPLDPPAWAFEQYINSDMPDVPVGDWADIWKEGYNPLKPDLSAGTLPPETLKRARAGYYGHLTHIDHQINRFIETLTDYELIDNTYICFVSDHGELLGDHNLFRKSLPYDGSSRVPFILAGPHDSAIKRGEIHSEVAELRDVMPTLLDCAGLPIPECVEGRSLLPVAREESVIWRDYIHCEHPHFGQSVQWLTDGKWKYIWRSEDGHEQLFNLEEDPQELHDLADYAEHAELLKSWRERLINELTGREEGFVKDGKLQTGIMPRACLSHIL